ncbi:peptidoglycan-binding protein [Streptomyces rochei]|uniref:peptidoglycan-binding protein n=1 Tax=Streptomyces rochei TaxID=1928 RepID=UPI0036F70329
MTSLKIISRASWGAKPWNGNPATIPLNQRTEWFVHYDGAHHITATGNAVPQAIDRQHQAQGWAGIGYNFVVDQAGNIFEGRGWTRQGAHCPGHNISGLSVQIAIGGDQKPSDRALAAARALYDEACRRAGRKLAKRGHKDGFATECPGPILYAWVQAGMPADGYEAAPDPDGSPSGGSASIARYQVTINGLTYGYGAYGPHVTKVGETLVKRGFGRHYKEGPGPRWTDADTENFSDFQVSLGFKGTDPHEDADGVPGETSLKALLGSLPSAAKPMPPFPGRQYFGPGKDNAHITTLGKQLVKKGFGDHYVTGPGPKWSDADRKNVEAFQRSRKELAGDADGLPGPLTWKLLFS